MLSKPDPEGLLGIDSKTERWDGKRKEEKV